MGIFSELFLKTPAIQDSIPAIMPPGAIAQIERGIVPTIRTDNLVLVIGESCHFAERAILLTEKVTRHIEGRSNGISVRVCKGVTYRTGRSRGTPVEEVSVERTKGLIFVTNRRIAFVADKNAFDKKYRYLTAITPYSDGIKLQFGAKSYTLLVPNGSAISQIIDLVRT